MASTDPSSSADGIDLSNLTSGSRARKGVKRMRVDENTVMGGSKPTLNVLDGPGTEIQKLPNVCKHLEAAAGKTDLLKTLHRLMYGKFAKPDVVLSNIMRFSGLPFRDSKLFPRGYDESYDSLMFRVNDLKMSTLRALFDAVGLPREPESFDDGKADKVNLVGRLTNWIETPKEVKPAAASSQLLQLLGASGGSSGAPAAALLKHLKRPRRQSSDDLSDADSDGAVDGSGAASPGSATDAAHATVPHPNAADSDIAARVEALVRSASKPSAMTMTALLRQLSREYGTRMQQRGAWVAGVLKSRFFGTDNALLGLAGGGNQQ